MRILISKELRRCILKSKEFLRILEVFESEDVVSLLASSSNLCIVSIPREALGPKTSRLPCGGGPSFPSGRLWWLLLALLIPPLRSILLPRSPKTAQLAAKIAQDSPTWTQHGHLGQIFSDLASIRDPKSSKNF